MEWLFFGCVQKKKFLLLIIIGTKKKTKDTAVVIHCTSLLSPSSRPKILYNPRREKLAWNASQDQALPLLSTS